MTGIAAEAIMIEVVGAIPETVMTDTVMMIVADRGICDNTRGQLSPKRTKYAEKLSAQMVELNVRLGVSLSCVSCSGVSLVTR